MSGNIKEVSEKKISCKTKYLLLHVFGLQQCLLYCIAGLMMLKPFTSHYKGPFTLRGIKARKPSQRRWHGTAASGRREVDKGGGRMPGGAWKSSSSWLSSAAATAARPRISLWRVLQRRLARPAGDRLTTALCVTWTRINTTALTTLNCAGRASCAHATDICLCQASTCTDSTIKQRA